LAIQKFAVADTLHPKSATQGHWIADDVIW